MPRLARAALGSAVTITLVCTTMTATAAQAGPGPGSGKPRTERVSTAADGSQADGSSMSAAISADGRRVAFTSTAPSFGCGPFTPCLLVKDLPTGEVTRIDLGSGNTYGYPLPSADGSRVAFSAGTRFTAPYLYDRTTGSSERLWPENPPGFNELGRVQSISPDGTHVAYTIGNRHGSDNFRLLYVRDTATGTDELISPAEEGDKAGASVSGDGERVAYGVRVDSETDPVDVFVKDRATGERTQVDTGLGTAYLVRITSDGRRVLLDAEGGLYVHDLRTGVSRRVAEGTAFSATADGRYAVVAGEDGMRVRDLRTGLRGAALPPDAQPGDAMLAADGLAVAFSSSASHLVEGDTNAESDAFVFSGGLRRNPAPMPSVTERISLRSDGQQWPGASYDPAMGEDKVVAFTSQGLTDPDDTNVLVNAAGGLAQVNSTAQGPSHEGTPCDSGRMVGYTATLPATDADPNPQPRVYRYRLQNGATDVVSAPTGGPAGNSSINSDGRYVAFEQGGAVHVRDLDTGDLEKAGSGRAPELSADGRRIAFQQGRNSYVRDLDTGSTTKVAGTEPSLSGTGTHLAYASGRSVYLLELATGKRQLVSVDRWGGRNDLPARNPSVNADGTVVAFESASSDLVKGDTNEVSDVFLRTVQ